MARERGQNVTLLMADETTFGTAPGGNWRRMPFMTLDLGATQAVQEDKVLSAGYAREDPDPFQDMLDTRGNVVVPVDIRNFGYWLKMVFGPATVSGSAAPYTHTFAAGASVLPSRSFEKQYPSTTGLSKYAVLTGVKADGLDLMWSQTQQQVPQATIALIGQAEAYATASGGGTPVVQAYTRYLQRMGSVQLGGSPVADLMTASLKYANGLEVVRPVNAAALPVGIDEGAVTLTGQVTVRHNDPTLMTNAIANTPVALSFGWTYDSNWSLSFSLPRVTLARPKVGVRGPDGVEVVFDWRASQTATQGDSMAIVLKSPLSAY